jgi:hypothetical protein
MLPQRHLRQIRHLQVPIRMIPGRTGVRRMCPRKPERLDYVSLLRQLEGQIQTHPTLRSQTKKLFAAQLRFFSRALSYSNRRTLPRLAPSRPKECHR